MRYLMRHRGEFLRYVKAASSEAAQIKSAALTFSDVLLLQKRL